MMNSDHYSSKGLCVPLRGTSHCEAAPLRAEIFSNGKLLKNDGVFTFVARPVATKKIAFPHSRSSASHCLFPFKAIPDASPFQVIGLHQVQSTPSFFIPLFTNRAICSCSLGSMLLELADSNPLVMTTQSHLCYSCKTGNPGPLSRNAQFRL